MSFNLLAPAFFPHYQPSSDSPVSLCNFSIMSLPLAQLFCGMPPEIIASLAPSINQPIPDGTFIHLLIQLANQSKKGAAAHQPPRGFSSLLSSLLHGHANCLQAIHKTNEQFNQHLKAQHLNRQTLQLIVLQLQNDFALMRYLLFSNKDITVKNSATSPLLNTNSNPKPTSSAFPFPCTDDPKPRRFTPVGAVGPPRVKLNNSANVARPSSHTSLNRPQVLGVLFLGLAPMDTTSSSNFTPMVSDALLANVHQSYSPSSLTTTTIYFSGPSRRSSTLVSVINWTH